MRSLLLLLIRENQITTFSFGRNSSATSFDVPRRSTFGRTSYFDAAEYVQVSHHARTTEVRMKLTFKSEQYRIRCFLLIFSRSISSYEANNILAAIRSGFVIVFTHSKIS